MLLCSDPSELNGFRLPLLSCLALSSIASVSDDVGAGMSSNTGGRDAVGEVMRGGCRVGTRVRRGRVSQFVKENEGWRREGETYEVGRSGCEGRKSKAVLLRRTRSHGRSIRMLSCEHMWVGVLSRSKLALNRSGAFRAG